MKPTELQNRIWRSGWGLQLTATGFAVVCAVLLAIVAGAIWLVYRDFMKILGSDHTDDES